MKAFTTFLLARAQSARQLLGLFLILLSALYPRVGWGQTTALVSWDFSDNDIIADAGTANNLSKTISGPGTIDYSAGVTNNAATYNMWQNGGSAGMEKFWQIEVNTTGYSNLSLSSAQKSSDTGPKNFKIQYRIGVSGAWSDFSPIVAITVANNFTSGVVSDAMIPIEANNKASVFIRWVMTSNAPVASGSSVASGGTSRIDDIIVTGTSGSTTPTISVPASTLTFNTTVGTPSAEQSYNVSGVNLTESINITAPAGYQLSATSGSYGSATNTLQLSATGGMVYGRLSGAATGTYNGNITHSSTGAMASVAVLGTVAAAPTAFIVASPTSISGLSTTQGTASASQIYTLTPTALTASITVTAPTGFEVSLAAASGFATSVTASRMAATAVYVRIAATAVAGPVSGTITNVSGSTSQDVSVSGTVSTAPVGGSVCLSDDFNDFSGNDGTRLSGVTTSGLTFYTNTASSGLFPNSAQFNSTGDRLETPILSATATALSFFIKGNGTNAASSLLVEGFNGSGYVAIVTISPLPTTGTVITYSATSSPVLSAGTYTRFRFTYTKGNGNLAFDDLSVTCSSPTIATEPTVQPTVSVTNVTSGTADVTVAGGNGTARLVIIRPTATTAAAPIDGNSYTASTAYGAGATTGPNNYVLVADGTTTSFTVTGLSPLTGYTVAVYAYNGSAGTQNYLTAMPGTANFATPAASVVTYTWNGTGNSWSAASSWTPARSVPAASDILVFDGNVTGSATADLDFTASQTISQLRLVNRVSVTLTNAGSGRILLLDGGTAGDDLVIGASSALRLQPSTASSPITIDITTGETARIAGAFTSDAATNTMAANRLIGRDASSIVVPMGGLFVAGPKSSGGPFDGSATNAVVFESGANYRQEGGTSPFDQQQPAAVVQFQRGSVYEFARMDGSPALSGRTYGTLRFSTISAGLANMGGGSRLTILDNLEVAAATEVGINLTNGVFIGGNVLVDAGGSLDFNPGSTSAVTFNGSTAQTISGPGPVVFGSASTLTVDNARGVTLLSPVQAIGGLDLQSGLLTTTDINLLTLAATSAIGGGSNASFVNGPVARVLPANTTGSRLFPVGKDGAYRPVTLTPTTLTRATTVTVEQLEGPAAPQPFNNGIVRVSRVRRYAITASPGITAPGTFMGTITLSFGPDDKVTDPAQSSLLIAQSDGTVWNSVGRSTSSGAADNGAFVAGTLTSAPFQTFDAFSVFVLASTDPDVAINPLPVQLLSFGAERRAGSVQIQWATATELNSAHFEVQRSATGQDFRTITTVAAQGGSSNRYEYSVSDRQPLPGTSYYRLRQIDLDGTDAYSAVASVDALGKVRVYPNPVETELTIELPTAGARYRIISVLGSVLMFGELPTTTAILNVAALPAGLYQLEITTSAGRDIRKIIKQ